MATGPSLTKIRPRHSANRVRRVGALLAAGALAVLALPSQAVAAASQTRASCSLTGEAAGHQRTPQAVGDYITLMATKGTTAAAIEQKLQSNWCLAKVGKTAPPARMGASPASSQADLDWYSSGLYYDIDYHYYIASSYWSWLNNHFIDNDTVVCLNNDVGGYDGVAMRFSGGEYQILSYSATTWGDPAMDPYPNDYGTVAMWPSSVSQYGVGFNYQDSATRMKNSLGLCEFGNYDLTMYRGVITIGLKALNGGRRNAQLFTDYEHTWNSNSVNNIGAGPYSFSVGWASSSEKWSRSEAGVISQIC